MNSNTFIGYEYKDVAVKRSMVNYYIDGYENFGWKLEGAREQIEKHDTVTLRFKRDRKIRNKVELTRLQRNFDACLKEIEALEFSKYVKPSAIAYGIGIAGTAFMVGAIFCFIASLTILGIIFTIPAAIGWVLPFFLYQKCLKKRTEEVTPFIEQKYDELYDVCEKANALLDHIK